jgi:hypothetical protein
MKLRMPAWIVSIVSLWALCAACDGGDATDDPDEERDAAVDIDADAGWDLEEPDVAASDTNGDVEPADGAAPDARRDTEMDGTDGSDAGEGGLVRQWDFDDGRQGWSASYTDYGEPQASTIEFESGIEPLPEGIDEQGDGFFVSGRNTPDDLFMFLKRSLGEQIDLEANSAYELEWRIEFASDAASGCAGIGGAPGESVYMKAGGSPVEPRRVEQDGGTQDYVLNVDKGNQSQGGEAASIAGNVANGIPCEEHDGEFATVVHEHTHSTPVETDAQGRMWLLVGTDSGFEGRTNLFYQSLEVRLEPVE